MKSKIQFIGIIYVFFVCLVLHESLFSQIQSISDPDVTPKETFIKRTACFIPMPLWSNLTST